MKPFEEVFRMGEYRLRGVGPDTDYDYPGYHALIESMGHEVLHHEDEDDYQGDSWYLLKDGERYGYLMFGWGSCSGCDAYEACSTFNEFRKLRDGLHNDIKWGTAEEVAAHIGERDEYDWYHDKEEFKAFRKKAAEVLDVAIPEPPCES